MLHSARKLTALFYHDAVETNCTDGDVRLVDGQTNTEGRVEMCRGYIWGAITDSDWGFDEARVTCRQLGHPSSCESK